MPGEPKRLDHPILIYIIGAFFTVVTLLVYGAVVYHFSLSPHGPAVLRPIKRMLEEQRRSAILEEAKRLDELEIHRHFHRIVEYPTLREELRPVCYICHSDYPHSKSKKVRALLNMHTQFFVCETCHIENKGKATIIYEWYNPLNPEPQGPFFGTRYHPETGSLLEVADQFSKIAPYFRQGENLESAIQKQDAPLAQDYMNVRDQLTPEQRDSVKKKFHVNIKAKGHACDACHVKNGVLDFKSLGFAQNRITDLEQLNIKGMITKYEEFYLPNLFRE